MICPTAGALNHMDRHIRMHHPAFLHGIEVDGQGGEVFLQPFEESCSKSGFPELLFWELRNWISCFSEARFIQPVGQGFQPGIDAVTRLMNAVIGVLRKK